MFNIIVIVRLRFIKSISATYKCRYIIFNRHTLLLSIVVKVLRNFNPKWECSVVTGGSYLYRTEQWRHLMGKELGKGVNAVHSNLKYKLKLNLHLYYIYINGRPHRYSCMVIVTNTHNYLPFNCLT